MSDGGAYDANLAADTFARLNLYIQQTHGSDLEFHVIAFGGGANIEQLQLIAGSSSNGKLHESADTTELSNLFVEIAGGGSVVDKLEAEIGKRVSDAVSDRLSIEYIALETISGSLINSTLFSTHKIKLRNPILDQNPIA